MALSDTINTLGNNITSLVSTRANKDLSNLSELGEARLAAAIAGGSSSSSEISPSVCKNLYIKKSGTSVQLKWEDPGDTIIDGKVISSWGGTKIVKKVGSYPTDPDDGTVVVDNKVQNRYLTAAYTDTITAGQNVFYKAFPYNTKNTFNLNDKNNFVDAIIYEFTINPNDSNPSTRVSYPAGCTNANFTPAKMNFSTGQFSYGDWEHAFFQPRPVMVKYNGTVDYELYKPDFSYKKDGVTKSDVANTSYGGNAMIAFPQVWIKYVMDGTLQHVYISNKQVDSNYHCYTHYNRLGTLVDEIYIMAYQPGNISSKLRSLSGITILTNNSGTTEINYAKANGDNWNLWDYGMVKMIEMLLILMGKTTNAEITYGCGRYSGANSKTGECDQKGMFYGTNANGPLKIFGIENYYANYWKRTNGCCYNGKILYKLTETTIDGSTVNGYNTDGTGYLSGPTLTGSSGGYIKECDLYSGAILPKTISGGSSTTYWSDGCWWANGGFALVGGPYSDGSLVGFSALTLSNAVGNASAAVGGSLSCKPLA